MYCCISVRPVRHGGVVAVRRWYDDVNYKNKNYCYNNYACGCRFFGVFATRACSLHLRFSLFLCCVVLPCRSCCLESSLWVCLCCFFVSLLPLVVSLYMRARVRVCVCDWCVWFCQNFVKYLLLCFSYSYTDEFAIRYIHFLCVLQI